MKRAYKNGYGPYFAGGLAAAIVMIAAGGGIFGGRAGALGAAAGALAVAADMYFLVRFGESWLQSSGGRRRAFFKGIAALVAKTVIPAGIIAVICFRGWVSAPAAALGAAALALIAPILLTICLVSCAPLEDKTPVAKWS